MERIIIIIITQVLLATQLSWIDRRRSGGAVELRSGGAEERRSGVAEERWSGGADEWLERWSSGEEEVKCQGQRSHDKVSYHRYILRIGHLGHFIHVPRVGHLAQCYCFISIIYNWANAIE